MKTLQVKGVVSIRMVLGIITGSGLYDFDLEHVEEKLIETEFGSAKVVFGTYQGKKVVFLARHGKNHKLLPNTINYRANMLALKKVGATAIVTTTVCGVLKENIPLGKLVVFDDLFFPDNRLSSGEICSIYTKPGDKKRGHYIFGSPFNEALRLLTLEVSLEIKPLKKSTYVHANGPRFNSKSEVRMMSQYADFVSQTAGPEIVLAGELEIPYILLGFGIDYANGVTEEPTPISVLNDNLEKSKLVFTQVIKNIIENYKSVNYDGFIYRFEK